MQSDSVRGVCIVVSLSLNFTTMQTPHTLRLMAALEQIKEKVPMSESETSDYCVYLLRQLSAGVLGETYLVVAASKLMENVYEIESYILSPKIEEQLHQSTQKFDGRGMPKEYGSFNLEFAMSEAELLGMRSVEDLLEQRAITANRPDFAFQHYYLDDKKGSLFGLKFRGTFIPQMTAIAENTQSEKLQRYMCAVLGKKLSKI